MLTERWCHLNYYQILKPQLVENFWVKCLHGKTIFLNYLTSYM